MSPAHNGTDGSPQFPIHQHDSGSYPSPGHSRFPLQAQGYDFDRLVDRVAKLFKMRSEEILNPGKQPQRVRARSLVCYWAVKDLGMNGTEVATLLGIIQSSVSRATRRGEKLALDNQYSLGVNRNA